MIRVTPLMDTPHAAASLAIRIRWPGASARVSSTM
jgi:hypothetical protein